MSYEVRCSRLVDYEIVRCFCEVGFDLGDSRSTGESFLTKERLERHVASQRCFTIAQKGLMESLLEQKMRTGRVEAAVRVHSNRAETDGPSHLFYSL